MRNADYTVFHPSRIEKGYSVFVRAVRVRFNRFLLGAHHHAAFGQIRLHLLDRILPEMEDRGAQSRAGFAFRQDFVDVL